MNNSFLSTNASQAYSIGLMRNNSRYNAALYDVLELYRADEREWEGPKEEFEARFFADFKNFLGTLVKDHSRRHDRSIQGFFPIGGPEEPSPVSNFDNRVEGSQQSINSLANRLDHALHGASNNPLIRPKIRRDPFKHLSTEAARRPATPRRNSHQDNGRNARLRIERPNNPSSKPPVVQVDRTANQRNNMGLNREKPREVVPIRGNFSLKPQQVRAERSINSQRNKALIQSKEKSKPIERQHPARGSTFKPQNVANELIYQNRRNTLMTEEVRVRNSTNVNQTRLAKNEKQVALRDLMKEIISKR